MFTRRARLLWLVFGVSDLILLAISFEIAYLVRSHISDMTLFYLSPAMATGLLFVAGVLWASTGMGLGVYRRMELLDGKYMMRDTLHQSFWLTAALATVLYLLKLGDISRAFIALLILVNCLFQATYRLSAGKMRRFLQREVGGYRYYLIVGTGPKALELSRIIEQNEEKGVRVIGLMAEPDGKNRREEIHGLPVRALEELPRMLEEHIIDEVIFAVSRSHLDKLEDVLLNC